MSGINKLFVKEFLNIFAETPTNHFQSDRKLLSTNLTKLGYDGKKNDAAAIRTFVNKILFEHIRDLQRIGLKYSFIPLDASTTTLVETWDNLIHVLEPYNFFVGDIFESLEAASSVKKQKQDVFQGRIAQERNVRESPVLDEHKALHLYYKQKWEDADNVETRAEYGELLNDISAIRKRLKTISTQHTLSDVIAEKPSTDEYLKNKELVKAFFDSTIAKKIGRAHV